ncbi:MAG TPA: hypothetical protein VD789_04775, partial [Thermomicrobiales bacterium]|nr:hypothetical protein [Thermomicrobiales bacterium]
LLTTHDLGDIEHLCDRVIVIDEGRVRFDGSAEALHAQFADRIEVTVDFATTPDQDSIDLPGSVRVERQGESRWHVTFDASKWTSGGAVRWLTTLGELRDIAISETSLEHIIREMYRGTTVPVPAAGVK